MTTHPNNPALKNPDFAKVVFDNAKRPHAWLAVGRHLRSSANAIFDRENQVAEKHYSELRRLAELHCEEGPFAMHYDESVYPFPNFDAAYMLVAFAIENFLKGIAIAKGLAVFSVQKLPENLSSHDLFYLHTFVQPQALVSRELLDGLTYMGTWRGRYPFPCSVQHFWPIDISGTMRAGGLSWPASHDEFNFYCDSLELQLEGLRDHQCDTTAKAK